MVVQGVWSFRVCSHSGGGYGQDGAGEGAGGRGGTCSLLTPPHENLNLKCKEKNENTHSD